MLLSLLLLNLEAAGPDTIPDAFTFTDQTDVARSSTITSAAITVSGIDSAATITVTGGEYDINASGTFVSTSGTVDNGDTVRARHTSSASYLTAVNTVVTIGGVSDTFSSTTLAAPATTYPTIYAGLSPAAAAGDVVTTDQPILTSAGGTVTLDVDGTYTVSGTPLESHYVSNIELFDDSTGLAHVMSPFGFYVNGTIRLGDYSDINVNTAETTVEGLGLTVTRATAYSSTIAEGLVISQSPAAYWLLNSSIPVVLTYSLGESTLTPTPKRRHALPRRIRRHVRV